MNEPSQVTQRAMKGESRVEQKESKRNYNP